MFETPDHEVHVFVQITEADRCLPWQAHVLFVVEIATCALQVKHRVLRVYNFQQGLVLRVLGHRINLIFKGFILGV